MAEQFDKITEPQEWIDELLKVYAPNSEDIDVALQNMGLKIKELTDALNAVKDWDIKQAMNHGIGVRFTLPDDLRKQAQNALQI